MFYLQVTSAFLSKEGEGLLAIGHYDHYVMTPPLIGQG